jgi:redox-sensitive bicupin YhaK (pirin superfamily)
MATPGTNVSTDTREVVRKVRGQPTSDGAGVRMTRVIGTQALDSFDPFLLLDEFRSDDPNDYVAGFPNHPHRGFETVTYMLAGRMRHGDDQGNEGLLGPGSVQWMTAGRGIVHSERSPAGARPDGPVLSGIQTWLALPSAKEEMEPAFEHVAKDALPVIEGSGASARVVMGRLWGATSPVTCHSPTIYADIALQPGGSLAVDPEADERALYLAEGDATVDRQPLKPRVLYLLRPGTRVTLRSERGAHVMLAGGAPLDGPRHVFWNFVSSRRDRIQQAKEDWKADRFPIVPDDPIERIPIPDVPKTVSYP